MRGAPPYSWPLDAEPRCPISRRAIRHLGVHIVPFGQAQQRKPPLLAPAPQLPPRTLARLAVGLPQFEQRGELGLVIFEGRAETGVGRSSPELRSAPAARAWAPARGRRAMRTSGTLNPATMASSSLLRESAGSRASARQPRIERQARHGPAAAGDAPLGIQRLQFLQQPIAVAERPRIGRIDEGETLRLAQSIGRQPQQQRREIRAQYFRLGERSARSKSSLREYSRTHRPGPSRPQRPLR
jgi:hypothetical protein